LDISRRAQRLLLTVSQAQSLTPLSNSAFDASPFIEILNCLNLAKRYWAGIQSFDQAGILRHHSIA